MTLRQMAIVTAGMAMFALAGSAQGEKPDANSLGLVPQPQSVVVSPGLVMALGPQSRVVACDEALLPLARILSEDIYRTTGLRLEAAKGEPKGKDIALRMDKALKGEAYTLKVTHEQAVVSGGTYQAVSWGTVTLLQAMAKTECDRVEIPQMTVQDAPAAEFRCAQVCNKHQVHRRQTLYEAIDLCRMYKINYFTLHRGGYQHLWALCPAFRENPLPKGGYDGGEALTDQELAQVIRYADERGVTIIADLGAGSFWGADWLFKAMPEFFDKPQYKNLGDKTQFLLDDPNYWAAVDVLVGRTAKLFKSSPWIHFGAVDGEVPTFGGTPWEQAFMKKHNLDSAGVWAYVLKRLDEIARKHGKKSMAYEGVQRSGAKQVNLPKDIVFLEYQDAYYPVQEMSADGYGIVNYSWQPLYVAGRGSPLAEVYNWDIRRWQNNWFKIREDRLPETAAVLGGMIGTWEGPDQASVPALRRRAAAMSERAWNPKAPKDYANFLRRLESTDGKVQQMFYPANVTIEGVSDHPSLDKHEAARFADELTITAKPVLPGTVHYTLDGSDPTAASPQYEKPLKLRATQFKAALFDPAGKQVGDVYGRHFEYAPIVADVQGVLKDWPTTGQPWWEPARVFQKAATITLKSGTPALAVRYTLDGKGPTAQDPLADKPLTVTKDTRVRAQCFDDKNQPAGAGYDVTFVNFGFEPNMLIGAETTSGVLGQAGKADPDGKLAVDGIIEKETHWGGVAPRWLTVSLASPFTIDRVQLFTYWDGGRFYQYTIEASVDGSKWKTIVDRSRNTEVATEKGYQDKFDPINMRYLRVNMLKNSANPAIHIVEIRAFEPAKPK